MLAKKILEYIKEQQKQENPEDIKADVMQYCERESICSQPVAHAVTIDLINKHKLKVVKDKPNSKTSPWVINDENEFTKINIEIDKLYSLTNNLTKFVAKKASFMDWLRKNRPYEKTHGTYMTLDFRNLVHFTQLLLYSRTGLLSGKIQNDIKIEEDREVLYLRLVQILTASEKLNRCRVPEVVRGLEQTLKKMKEHSVVKGSLWANTFDIIMKIDPESY